MVEVIILWFDIPQIDYTNTSTQSIWTVTKQKYLLITVNNGISTNQFDIVHCLESDWLGGWYKETDIIMANNRSMANFSD